MRRIGIAARLAPAALVACLSAPGAAAAQTLEAGLQGFEEVPAVFTTGTGEFHGELADGTLAFELSYADLVGSVREAHIHFGQRGANGGVSAFLCSNLGNAPAGTPACPEAQAAGPATVIGVIGPTDVIGPEAQGIEPGAFDKLAEAIRRGLAYVNVHSDLFPGGEIRGQIGNDMKTFTLAITGAEGTRFTGQCTLTTAAGEETFELSGTVPRQEELTGDALACRIESAGAIVVEIGHDGSVSRSVTSGGSINVSTR